MPRLKTPAEPPEKGKGLQIDPTKYTAPVVLNLAELTMLQQLLTQVPLSGTPDNLEDMLAVIRSIRNKLQLAGQVVQRKLPGGL